MFWHRSLYSKRSLPEIDTRPPISINELTAAESDQNWWSERGFIVIQEHSLRAHVHVRGLRQPVDVYVIYSFLCTDTPRSTLTRDTESFLFTARWATNSTLYLVYPSFSSVLLWAIYESWLRKLLFDGSLSPPFRPPLYWGDKCPQCPKSKDWENLS